MKKTGAFLFVFVAISLFVVGLYSKLVQNAIGVSLSFIRPGYWGQVEKTWENKSSEFLLKKLNGNSDFQVGIATTILARRKEKAAVPYLLEAIESRNEQTRISAFIALGKIGDGRSIGPLFEIVIQGRGHRDFLSAMEALSMMHDERVYPEVVRMANDSYQTAWVVDMLAQFPEKAETVPLLRKIAEEDPEGYVRENAKKALEKILEFQGKPATLKAVDPTLKP